MEESVALDRKKQKKFVRSIQGIKKLLKKNAEKSPAPATEPVAKPKPVVEVKPTKEKKKVEKKVKHERGLVYLGHIPHGFYEHQMTQYFSQFGGVTNCRVIKSKRTGRSKGYAFVEFREPSVAQIVAETMNNYLMGKRLIKAAYIPPEKQRKKVKRMMWSTSHNPTTERRLKYKKAHNANKTTREELKKGRKIMANLDKIKKKLKGRGIDYDFFMPVDVPDGLFKVKAEEKAESKDEKPEKAKLIKEETDTKDVKNEVKETKKPDSKKKQKKSKNESDKVVNKKNKKDTVKIETDTDEQKTKNDKLKTAGVKSVEHFIKIKEDSEDSDSAVEFDSDEYEKMLEIESDEDSEVEDESDEDISDAQDNSDEDDGSDSADSDEEDNESGDEIVMEMPPKKRQMQPTPKLVTPVTKQVKMQPKNTNAVKRKQPPKPEIIQNKKSKFEKNNKQQAVKKQFKKKK